jgi:prepilin-type N-terminal cleavage/methylation domain-containing protein
LHDPSFLKTKTPAGFSLLEIMIVVVILGLLGAMGIIAFQHNRNRVMASALGADLRVYRDAVDQCLMDTGQYNLGAPAGQLSDLLKPYIRLGNWTSPTPVGGKWVVDSQLDGISLSVGVEGFTASSVAIELADRLFDDGNLTTGRMRLIGSGKLIYIVEE